MGYLLVTPRFTEVDIRLGNNLRWEHDHLFVMYAALTRIMIFTQDSPASKCSMILPRSEIASALDGFRLLQVFQVHPLTQYLVSYYYIVRRVDP